MTRVSVEYLVEKYGKHQEASTDPILQDLDHFDWSAAGHAYGDASDVPALLRAALSQVQEDREMATVALFGELCHQGSVYEASALAVPFLFRMLEYPNTPDRATIACLLASLAYGSPGTYEEPRYKWVDATRQAVGKRLELLYPFLEHDEPEVRLFMVEALTQFPHRRKEYSSLLRTILETEPDESVRKGIYDALAVQGPKE